MTCLVTLFDRKLQVFKNSPKWTIFGIFNELLATQNVQNVNVARFARKVECDFFCDFQTPSHFYFSLSHMSGNTDWSGFLAFFMNFCKHSSLRSPSWMRLFLLFFHHDNISFFCRWVGSPIPFVLSTRWLCMARANIYPLLSAGEMLRFHGIKVADVAHIAPPEIMVHSSSCRSCWGCLLAKDWP